MSRRAHVVLWTALLGGCGLEPAAPPVVRPTPAAVADAQEPAHPALVAMQSRPLDYTRHARCRMDCRHIAEADVHQVLARGTLDPARTRTDGRCPSHAVESTLDGRDLRVVFAECPTETRVVTVIDLDREWSCSCD